MAGVDLPTLKELMGHESISTTMKYVHPTPEHKLRAVLRLLCSAMTSGLWAIFGPTLFCAKN